MLGLGSNLGSGSGPIGPQASQQQPSSYGDLFEMATHSGAQHTLSTEDSITDSNSVTKTNVLKFEAAQDFSFSHDPYLIMTNGAEDVADSVAATLTFSLLLATTNTGNIPNLYAAIKVRAKTGTFVNVPLTSDDISTGEWTDFSVSLTTGSSGQKITFDLDHAGGGAIDTGDIFYLHNVTIAAD